MGSPDLVPVGVTLNDLRRAVQRLASLYLNADSTRTFASLTLSSLTASRLVSTNSSKVLTSADLYSWVTETSNQVLIADDGDGTITFSTPQSIHTGASPTFAGLTLSNIGAEGSDVDKFLVDSSGVIKYRTGAQVLSDIDGSSSSHLHDGDTLQHDAVNSDGGAFSFTTTGLVTFNQSIASANYAASNKLTACATNAGALDFSAASKTLTVEDDAIVSQDYSTNAAPTFAGVIPHTDDTNDLGKSELGEAEYTIKVNQTLNSGNAAISSTSYKGQTFTPSGDYNLGRVSFWMRGSLAGSTNVTMSVTATTAGLPSGDDLATVVIDGSTISDSEEEWIDFDIEPPLAVSNGVVYACFASVPSGTYYTFGYKNSDEVAGGNYLQGGPGAWSAVPTYDATFRLYAAEQPTEYTRWEDLYLSGVLHDGTVSLSVDNAKDAYDHSLLTSGNPHSVTPTELSLVIGTNTQAWDAGLDSLAGLTYAAASFVKMTGANTFALRTIGETADDLEGTIVHDNLASIPANDHIDHTGVTLTAGLGLTGSGDISASRTFDMDIAGLTEDTAPQATADYVATYDNTASTHKKVLVEDLGPFGNVTRTQTVNLLQSESAAEIQAKIDALGKYIPTGQTVTFQFETGGTHTLDAYIEFAGFFGGGEIAIQGNIAEAGAQTKHTTQDTILNFNDDTDGLRITNTEVWVLVKNLKIIVECDVADTKCIFADIGNRVEAWWCYFVGNATGNGRGLTARYCRYARSYQCLVDNLKYGLTSSASRLHAWDNDDTGTPPLYGLWANQIAYIGKQSTQISGSTADELIDAGSQII